MRSPWLLVFAIVILVACAVYFVSPETFSFLDSGQQAIVSESVKPGFGFSIDNLGRVRVTASQPFTLVSGVMDKGENQRGETDIKSFIKDGVQTIDTSILPGTYWVDSKDPVFVEVFEQLPKWVTFSIRG